MNPDPFDPLSAARSLRAPPAVLATAMSVLIVSPATAGDPLVEAQLEKAVDAVGEAARWEIQERSIPSISVALVASNGACERR